MPLPAPKTSAPSFNAVLDARLEGIAPSRRRRRLVATPDPARSVRVLAGGTPCTSFCSNDYLGLAGHPEVIEAFVAAANRYGVGSGASHLVSGHGPEHEALEADLAQLTGRPRALVFSTGYMANLGIGSALITAGDRVFEDRLNHASLLDAGLSSGARFGRYPHCSAAGLAKRLARAQPADSSTCGWVLTDGVFSMDGDVAPLVELAAVARSHGAFLVVDDAHGIGVRGPGGCGTAGAAGLDIDAVPILMGTLGKALGTFGAFVAGSEQLIEMLIQKARTYIYTTALPPAVAAATRASIRLARADDWRRTRLEQHVARFRAGAAALGLTLMPSATAIQPLLVGTDAAALEASAKLLSMGILVSAIRPPTVPEGTARLRITFSAAHEEADIEQLIDALSRLRIGRSVP